MNRNKIPTLILGLWLAGSAVSAWAQPPVRQLVGPGRCMECHTPPAVPGLSAPTESFIQDAHGRAGLGCADCHGGDARAADARNAHASTAGYVGIPEPNDIPTICADCHGDAIFMRAHNPDLPVNQLQEYATSRHGQLLEMGLRKVAHCASCHTAHDVRSADDPLSSIYPVNLPATCATCHADADYMEGFPIVTDQFDKYATSVHGRKLLEDEDVAAPACNDCHGNHGAMPPGVESLGQVCGTCHALNAELVDQSSHSDIFALRELGQCTVCHDYHAIAPPTPLEFDMGPKSSCIACHRRDDPGWKAGKQMFSEVNALIELRDEALAALDQAEDFGMHVSDARFILVDFRKNFLQMRTTSHALDVENYLDAVREAGEQVTEALTQGEAAIAEFHLRRRWLMAFLLPSLPVVILLLVKIINLDEEANEQGGN